MTMLLCQAMLFFHTPIEVRPKLVLEPVAPEVDAYLQSPRCIEIDDRGRIYALDNLARVVFVWDKNGRFLTTFGKEGEGPGEFSFYGDGVTQGYVSAVDDAIYVYDGARRLLSRFDMDYRFISAEPFHGNGGRTLYFNMTRDGAILLYQQNYGIETPFRELALYNPKLSHFKTLYREDDKTYDIRRENGKTVKIVINAYLPTMAAFCDTGDNEILVGRNGRPEFDIYSSSGEKLRTIRFELTPKELTQADREDFLNRPNIRRDSRIKVNFPERRPYYQILLPVGDQFLIFDYSLDFTEVDGFLIDRKGKIKGSFHYVCGDNGGIYGARGRIIAIRVDSEGEYRLEELAFAANSDSRSGAE